MSKSFGYKSLSLAVASLLATTGVQAAGLDRSGQDVTAFLQDGTYAEAVYTYIDADVSGYDNGVATGASKTDYQKGRSTGDAAEAYDFFRFGVKADVNDRFSVGVIYDEPFGAAVQYEGESNFVGAGAADTWTALTAGTTLEAKPFAEIAERVGQYHRAGNLVKKQIKAGVKKELETATKSAIKKKNPDWSTDQVNAATKALVTDEKVEEAIQKMSSAVAVTAAAAAQQGQGTNVEIRTRNTALLAGAKFGANRNFQIYGGPAVQHLTGEVHLRGTAYQAAQGYDARISPDTAVGWVAGVAYYKPEIALKAALTYRSEIEHKSEISEVFPALGARGVSTRDFKVKLPESYNLDFQTGINPTTLLTAKVRYVPWSDFTIEPPTYGDATALVNNGQPLPIVSYSKDQWSAEVGLGKKLSDKVAVSVSYGYDSGAGNPTTTLGPIKGYHSLGLGAKYSINNNWSVSVGGKYLRFGDATANLPTDATAGQFDKNDGFIAGVKLAYQAK